MPLIRLSHARQQAVRIARFAALVEPPSYRPRARADPWQRRDALSGGLAPQVLWQAALARAPATLLSLDPRRATACELVPGALQLPRDRCLERILQFHFAFHVGIGSSLWNICRRGRA